MRPDWRVKRLCFSEPGSVCRAKKGAHCLSDIRRWKEQTRPDWIKGGRRPVFQFGRRADSSPLLRWE